MISSARLEAWAKAGFQLAALLSTFLVLSSLIVLVVLGSSWARDHVSELIWGAAASFAWAGFVMAIAAPLGWTAAIWRALYPTGMGAKLTTGMIATIDAVPPVAMGVLGSWLVASGAAPRMTLLLLLTMVGFGGVARAMARRFGQDLHETYTAALAVGATRFDAITQIIVRAKLPSLIAAALRGTGRVVGEALIPMLVLGGSFSMGLAPSVLREGGGQLGASSAYALGTALIVMGCARLARWMEQL